MLPQIFGLVETQIVLNFPEVCFELNVCAQIQLPAPFDLRTQIVDNAVSESTHALSVSTCLAVRLERSERRFHRGLHSLPELSGCCFVLRVDSLFGNASHLAELFCLDVEAYIPCVRQRREDDVEAEARAQVICRDWPVALVVCIPEPRLPLELQRVERECEILNRGEKLLVSHFVEPFHVLEVEL